MNDPSDETKPAAAENPKDRDEKRPTDSDTEDQDTTAAESADTGSNDSDSSETESAETESKGSDNGEKSTSSKTSGDSKKTSGPKNSDNSKKADASEKSEDADTVVAHPEDDEDTVADSADSKAKGADSEAKDSEASESPAPEASEGSATEADPTEETARWAPPVDDQSADSAPDQAGYQQAPPYPPGANGYSPGSDPYVQGGSAYSQGADPYAQKAYPQNSGPYAQTPGAYPQGSGPYAQGPGPYPQGQYPQYAGAYPQNAAAQGSGPFAPGMGPNGSGPVPYPAGPGQPGNSPTSRLTSALAKGATWRAALIPPGIALLGGIIVAIILTVVVASLPEFSSMSEDVGFNLDGLSYAAPFILLALSLFGSAVLRMDINAPDTFDAKLSIFMSGAPLVITIIVIGLLWWMTKLSERRSPASNRVATWVRIAVSTLAMTLVLFLLQLIFAARFSSFEDEGTVSFSFSAITARSFFLPLLAILITSIAGRVAGHFKGTEAIGAPFLRWAVPPLLVTWVHLVINVGLFSIVALFVLPFSVDMPGQLVPLTFINMGLILTSLTHLGGISASAQGDLGFYSDSFSENLTIFSHDAPGQLWLGLLVVIVALLISTFVATVTRRPSWTVVEQDKLQWASAWKLPLAFCLAWGLLSLLAIPMRMSMSGSAEAAMIFDGSGAARAGIGPLAWTFLIFAVWGGIIEVLSRTLGPRLVLTFPAMARIAAGRAVHPHWGPYLGMSEPRFAFVHPDLAREATQAPPPVAPAPGQVPGQTPGQVPGQAGSFPGQAPGQAGSVPGQAPGQTGSVPGQGGGPGQGGSQGFAGQADPQNAAGSQPNASQQGGSQPWAQAGSQQGAQAYSAPVGPQSGSMSAGQQPYASPASQQPYATPAGQQAYAAQDPYGNPYGNHPYGAAPAKPFDKRKTMLITTIAGGAVLLLLAALIVVTQVNGHMFGPEATAEKYFSKLSDGDAEGALKLADVDVPQESRTLLTNDVLGGAKALPDDVTVDDADISGDTATVSVSYDIAGSKGNSTLTLHKAGKKALFFDDWALQSPNLRVLAVDTPGLKKVKVNGVDVDTDGSALSLPAFPGLYTIGMAEKSDLITADPVEIRAFLSDDTDMEGEDTPQLAAQPSDDFRAEVDKQVKTLIDSCAKKSVAEPDGCPFGSSSADSSDATDLKWSISSYPTVTVSDETTGTDDGSGGYGDPSDSGDEGDSTGPNGGPAWRISSDSDGEALVTGSYEILDDDEPFDDTVSFSVNGTAEVVDDKVVITISDSDSWDW
jgi:hypothetical protein